MHREPLSCEMEVSIANAQTKSCSLFVVLRNKKSALIVTPESGGINGFVRLSASSAILISDRLGFCKTCFCFQGAVLELNLAKRATYRT